MQHLQFITMTSSVTKLDWTLFITSSNYANFSPWLSQSSNWLLTITNSLHSETYIAFSQIVRDFLVFWYLNQSKIQIVNGKWIEIVPHWAPVLPIDFACNSHHIRSNKCISNKQNHTLISILSRLKATWPSYHERGTSKSIKTCIIEFENQNKNSRNNDQLKIIQELCI